MHPCVARQRIARNSMRCGQRIDIVSHARTGRNLRMIRPGRGMTFVKRAMVEEMRLPRQLHAKRFAQNHDALMRAIGFIG